jgi:chloride channel protein, CIC family
MNRTTATDERLTGLGLLGLSLAAACIGLATAAGVWAYDRAIFYTHAFAFGVLAGLLGQWGGWTLALIPALGGLIVALIVHWTHRGAQLVSMAYIIDGVAEQGGRLLHRTGVGFIVAAAVGIGFGAPVGSDTPSAMIGGHLGSWLGERTHQRALFVRVLVVAGVAAGIAATYFAQLAAVFFAMEIVLGGFGGVVFVVPVMISVAAAGFFTYMIGGAPPQYGQLLGVVRWDASILLYAGAALIATLASIAYVNLLPTFSHFWSRLALPFWAKTMLAGLLVGVVGLWLPDVRGTGLDQMKQIFGGAVSSAGLLILIALARLILTPSSLGAGFAGGLIGPALLIGAALGATYGDLVVRFFPDLGMAPVGFAMIATAAMLGGTFHAPLFGAMMMFQMVDDYRFLVPLLMASAIGYGLAQRFQPGSAYTYVLSDLGIDLIQGTYTRSDRAP